ncbi:MAG TPA: peptide ABC transporter substrate-binding protein [Egibacteraceae bacterium]|nr:peptide ABC transporter substrate-binding protein [Egibacteraceae bacterium]
MDSMDKAGWIKAVAVAVALLLGAVACDDGGDAEAPADDTASPTEAGAAEPDEPVERTPVNGGTVILGADEEPSTLNAAVEEGNTFINGYIATAVLSPLWRITPEHTFEPLLLEDAEVTTDPFTVTYRLKEGLQWSDGEPITAHDVVFTHRTIMDERFDIISREGHELVRNAQAIDDRTARFVFRRPYPAWRTMFSEPEGAILPRHRLRGEDFNEMWREHIPVSSGPLEFDRWEPGQELILKRNDRYWGDAPSLDEVVISFYDSLQDLLLALREGAVDVLYPPTGFGLREQLETMDDIEIDSAGGPLWEVIDFNTAAPPLNRPYVRQAVAKAINRQRLIDEILAEVDPDVALLDSVLWLAEEPDYQDHWSQQLSYDPGEAQRLLADNDCTRVEGIWHCDDQPLQLRFVTTADVELRSRQFELIRRDLAAVGIKVEEEFSAPEEIFAPEFLASRRDWHLLSFARRYSANPLDVQAPWRCDVARDINNTKYCNRQVNALFDRAAAEVDDERRVDLLRRADSLIAQDVPAIPLYQRPTFLVSRGAIQGPRNNPTEWGPLWNVEDWVLTQ